MEPQTLALLLPKWQSEDCVVTFTDGDPYEIKDLDIVGHHGDRFEICVRFDKCLRPSVALREALGNGYLKTERVSWTSIEPRHPVGKTYLIEEIDSVFDRSKNYCIFERGRA